MAEIYTRLRRLPDPKDGKLSIRLVTGAPTPPPDFAVDVVHGDNAVEFVFNPQHELRSLDRAIFFFSDKIEALFFDLDPQLSQKIACHMGHCAYGSVRRRDWRYGLSMSVKLQTASAAAEVEERIIADKVSNDGDRKGERCSVCLKRFRRGKVFTQLKCLHKFHCECIAKWLMRKRTCPLCRVQARWHIKSQLS